MNVFEVLDCQPRCVCCGGTAVVSHVARQQAVLRDISGGRFLGRSRSFRGGHRSVGSSLE